MEAFALPRPVPHRDAVGWAPAGVRKVPPAEARVPVARIVAGQVPAGVGKRWFPGSGGRGWSWRAGKTV